MKHQDKVEAEGTQGELFKRRRAELPEAERVESLRGKLYQKAKQEREYKFYVLYDKLFIPYMLRAAWKQVKANNGAPGIDGMSVTDVERIGVEEYLQTLGEELRTQSYRPSAVKRVMIPKANGGERPLGIPTVKDRIAQTVCKLVIEPIFEADFEESSYGFRPERSSKDAMATIKGHLQKGKTEVLDADLSKYFDTIPHDKLLKALKERISDPRILRLISLWLKTPVYEDGQFKGGKKNAVGTPQGGVISPLLANIYLHLLDRIVNKPGSTFGKLGISIVRYADDFVLMGKRITEEALNKLKSILEKMGLTLNETKTKRIQSEQEAFNFLGHTIRYDRDIRGRDSKYWNICPSKKAEQKIRDGLSEYLQKHGHSPVREIVEGINAKVRGWLNYFSIKGVSYVTMSKKRLRVYLQQKLNRYFNRKSQRKCRLYRQRAFEVLVQKNGLIDPTKYAC
ncbi:MAG: group II intron reverse transcriptase/maturase [Mucilaginibacter sp.]|nr:group II intron reverse transcriptase/maturase [Mucilaginibacter sp.]